MDLKMKDDRVSSIIKAIDSLTDYTGQIGSWCSLLMVMTMLLVVVLRYGFQIGSISLQESITYLNCNIFTSGVAYTLKEDAHVRVDVMYSKLRIKSKALVDLLGTLVFLGLTAGFILWTSWDYVSVSWRIREGSAESSGLPYVYVLKTSILIIPIMLLIQGLSEFLKAYKIYHKN